MNASLQRAHKLQLPCINAQTWNIVFVKQITVASFRFGVVQCGYVDDYYFSVLIYLNVQPINYRIIRIQ